MGLTRVQATPVATPVGAPTVAVTFATPPSVGNSVVVAVIGSPTTPFPVGACVDNKGNAPYTRARTQDGGFFGTLGVYVGRVTATGSSFTITIAPGFGSVNFMAVAFEVAQVGGGLIVDVGAGGAGSGLTPSTVTTTGSGTENFVVALCSLGATQTSIAITGTVPASPTWTQEAENLTLAGEIDSRIVPGPTVHQITWTGTGSGWIGAMLVALKASPIPVSSLPPIPWAVVSGFWSKHMDSYTEWIPITASDTVDIASGLTHAVLVGGAGDVTAVMQNNRAVTITGLPAGAWVPIRARRINATGTTATGLVALYSR